MAVNAIGAGISCWRCFWRIFNNWFHGYGAIKAYFTAFGRSSSAYRGQKIRGLRLKGGIHRGDILIDLLIGRCYIEKRVVVSNYTRLLVSDDPFGESCARGWTCERTEGVSHFCLPTATTGFLGKSNG